MTGEELFNRFRFAMADEGIEMDPWPTLDLLEQNAWKSLAEDLTNDQGGT